MKLQFKHQKFQAEAAKAVVDVFAGQPLLTPTYMIDRGTNYQGTLTEDEDFTGWANALIQPHVVGEEGCEILERIRKIQRANLIQPSEKLEGRYNLTIEMETGVGKTYTYIKTMYELNKHYGWRKFIVVVPSVAIREGVYKSFQITQEHFAEEYGKKIHFFIYNSMRLDEIDHFASDNSINVMIINAQAFNAKGKDARRIYMKLDAFRSRRPIDVIAKTNPILIIDEPQSVEGVQTRAKLKEFNPLMTLRYSATHRPDSIYNMVYRLDAVDAYNQRLVKKISVKGISVSGTTATEGFLYLERVNLSKDAPTATLQMDVKGRAGVRRKSLKVKTGINLYDLSNGLEEYKNNFVVSAIDGLENSIEFINGVKLSVGDVVGQMNETQLRRIQIRETIRSHIERERQLYHCGIKVLSLFFIDEVEKYRYYDTANQAQNGPYVTTFEEEYNGVLEELKAELVDDEMRDYLEYLNQIAPERTHAGYFSIDRNGRMINSNENDISAYDLIMKDKERLLDRDPQRSPVRFIFSHSALREGWDNPNVFQICTLKQSDATVRKRQEIGRGLRLSVNDRGERMDATLLGEDVHNINLLTVIANESYETFAKKLQEELSEELTRPRVVDYTLFIDKTLTCQDSGEKLELDESTANILCETLHKCGYLEELEETATDKKHSKKAKAQANGKYRVAEKFYEDKQSGQLTIAHGIANFTPYSDSIAEILDSIYDVRKIEIEDARSSVDLKLNRDKLKMKEFQSLWEKINKKSIYTVDFDTNELINKAIRALDQKLRVTPIYYKVKTGTIEHMNMYGDTTSDTLFVGEAVGEEKADVTIVNSKVKFDLVGKLVEETNLTRNTIVEILTKIQPSVFSQFKTNPEEFILKAASLINDEKATTIIEHITYNVCEEKYETSLFTDAMMKGQRDRNVMEAKKHLYDHVLVDSSNEVKFAQALEESNSVAVYVKLPKGFYISTPMGRYNPDWAIAFYEEGIKHIYFVAETKGSMNSLQLRLIEEKKIECARKHFEAISGGNVVYDVVDSYDTLLHKVMR